ncbi:MULTISPECIES: GMC oxidoreductase [Thermomonospora]|uniref:Cholesterol oxidase n=1 Tax=Thermomonospora curvata (strain ATCC 19995 / DSM 43183 / JCM 3096 / KCTC 9072 / NBRC 15933 / NCIMB 10081 / Henssen B9) TaxID=471852 RepID=D1ADV3_THECD|nr:MULTISPECIES: GMC family oxidoreductase [Thermomonospora]ACY97563.1 glucose-methanol-choline oxidoreductase [Thermomonospora curvata DSM 43183]
MATEVKVSEHVDAVVVGSGFGGSVAAYRLAEAGRSVVLLERGQPFPPGSFPRSPAEMSRAFWDPREGLYGMYDVWSFAGCDSVVSSGLGGGSLIYANVLLRKDERWFIHERRTPGGGYEPWPVSRAELDPHYDAVERMLGATPYPLHHPAYADTPKTHAMQDAAAELGLDWFLPPLAVSFAPSPGAEPGIGLPIVEPEYGNLHGAPRRTCRLCAECDIGCNDGAKNSLDFTYLSAARHHGADLRTCCEVTAIRPRPGGGYEVDYVRHDPAVKARRTKPHTIGCDRLILAAGTYGTTYLLLRSRENLPGLSPALGTRFCGNGDLLTFLTRAKDRDRVRLLDASRGTVITSAIRLPDEADGDPAARGLRGAYIEDGGYPDFVNWMVEGADFGDQIARAVRFLWERFVDFFSGAPDTNLSAELSELIGDGALSISSLPLLGMGRDTPDGVLRLRGDRLEATWTAKTSEVHFERLRKIMQRIADVLGADYADNPIWFRKRVITVHPLGGAPMGRHPGEGVCDPYGQVFGHPGLYIADGAALPGPVGANPALTIAALADRMCTRLLETGAGPVATGAATGSTGAGSPAGPPRAGATSLSFTEEMKGSWTPGTADPRAGERGDGRRPLAFRLTITAADVDRFLAEPEHLAEATGWIESPALGGRRPVTRGHFNLFLATGDPDRRTMRYRLHFTDDRDRPLTLVGWKDVRPGPPTRIWADTSTLYARILQGHVDEGQEETAPVVGAGVLRIRPADFAEQLTTFRTSGPGGLAALVRFGRFFAGELWEVYGPDR